MTTTTITSTEMDYLKLTHEKLYAALKMSFKILGTSGVFKYSESLNQRFDDMTLHLNPTSDKCYTDFKGVYIGLLFEYIKEGNLDQAYNVAEIIIAHEVGHIRFTSKKEWDSFVHASPAKYKKLSQVARDILNIVEDRREEYHMGKISRDIRRGFYWLCQRMAEGIQSNYDEHIKPAQELSAIEKIMHIRNGILFISCTRTLPKIENEEVMEYLKKIYPYMVYSYKAKSTKNAVKVTEKIMDILEPLRDEYNEETDQKMDAMFELRSQGSYEQMEEEDMKEFEEMTKAISGESQDEEEDSDFPDELEELLDEMSSEVQKEMEKTENSSSGQSQESDESGSEGESDDLDSENKSESSSSKNDEENDENEDEFGSDGESENSDSEEKSNGASSKSDEETDEENEDTSGDSSEDKSEEKGGDNDSESTESDSSTEDDRTSTSSPSDSTKSSDEIDGDDNDDAGKDDGTSESSSENTDDETNSESTREKDKKSKPQKQKRNINDYVEDIASQLDKYSDKIEDEVKEKLDAIERELNRPVTKEILEDYLNSSAKSTQQKIREEKEEKKLTELDPNFDEKMHNGYKVIFKDKKDMFSFNYMEYSEVIQPILNVAKRTAEELKTLSERKYQSILRLQRKGRLDRRALVNAAAFKDEKAFKRRQLHIDKLDMDVMLLVDVSGSNGTHIRNDKNGTVISRYEMNQIVSILVHESLKRAKFKHAIWSFEETEYAETLMAPMVDFSNCFEKDSGLKLKDIGAYRNNRDGLAIAYAGDYLHQHSKSDKKLLIVLSDGQPYAANYGGHQAIHDVKKQVQDLKEKGISTIGIFTGHESENQYFKLMYESCLFANNDSIFSLPKELKIKLVKEFEDYLKKF